MAELDAVGEPAVVVGQGEELVAFDVLVLIRVGQGRVGADLLPAGSAGLDAETGYVLGIGRRGQVRRYHHGQDIALVLRRMTSPAVAGVGVGLGRRYPMHASEGGRRGFWVVSVADSPSSRSAFDPLETETPRAGL